MSTKTMMKHLLVKRVGKSSMRNKEDILWDEYFHTRNVKSETELIKNYTPLVYHVIKNTKRPMVTILDFEDIVQFCFGGLVTCIRKYKPETTVPFKNFAYTRMSGAIIDACRSNSALSRSEMKNLEKDSIEFITAYNFTSPCELNVEMNLAVENDENEIDDKNIMVGKCINSLKEPYKEVSYQYFFGNKTMKEIGKEFKVSESRISQILKKTKDKIRKYEKCLHQLENV